MSATQTAETQSNLLLEAFSSFTEASSCLERAYWELLEKVEHLSGQLERSNYYLTTVLQNLPCGVLVVNNEKNVTMLNRVAADLFGLKDFTIPFPLTELLKGAAFSDRASSLGQAACDLTEITLSGSDKTLQCLWSRMRNKERVLVVQDVTEVRRLERKIQDAEKTAAKGEMALEVAHEIRNPLGALELFGSLLSEEDLSEQEREQYLINLQIGIRSLNTVLTNMLCFSRRPEPVTEAVRVGEIVESALDLMRPLMSQRGIDLEVVCKDRELAFLDHEMLRQIINNLVTNALQALPQGGKLTIETGSNQDSVSIMVRDDGAGIPEQQRKLIFDSGFTTHEDGHGLGLAIVQRFVEAQGGSIKIKSEKDWGTEFVLSFPVGKGVQ
jgi:signal transduction histidine kinase